MWVTGVQTCALPIWEVMPEPTQDGALFTAVVFSVATPALVLAIGRLMAVLAQTIGQLMEEGDTMRLGMTTTTVVVEVVSEVVGCSMAEAAAPTMELAMGASVVTRMPIKEPLMVSSTRVREMSFMIIWVTAIEGGMSSEELEAASTISVVVEAAEERYCDRWK